MGTTPRNTICLSTLASLLAAGTLFAQALPPADPEAAFTDESGQAIQNVVIFNNLEPLPEDRFNSDSNFALDVVGKSVPGQTEELTAVLVIPKTNVRAQVLAAAISYLSGTRLVNLGLYSDNMGVPGTPLPGGQGSTTDIPDSDTCCEMAKVILPGQGVTLVAGTRYWLVASADDVAAPNFRGYWRVSYFARSADLIPPDSWSSSAGQWPAAQIRGTRTQAVSSFKESEFVSQSPDTAPDLGTIFTNLGSPVDDLYNSGGTGFYVAGNNAFDVPEIWQAVPFIARKNSHATTLAAAIGWVSGTNV